jgi:hypothetical protein
MLLAACGCISRTQKYLDGTSRNFERNQVRHRSLRADLLDRLVLSPDVAARSLGLRGIWFLPIKSER